MIFNTFSENFVFLPPEKNEILSDGENAIQRCGIDDVARFDLSSFTKAK